MPIRICILLLMQSAPLAGTATLPLHFLDSDDEDAIRRPRRTRRFTTASRLPIGVLPRKRLASSATGGASPNANTAIVVFTKVNVERIF